MSYASVRPRVQALGLSASAPWPGDRFWRPPKAVQLSFSLFLSLSLSLSSMRLLLQHYPCPDVVCCGRKISLLLCTRHCHFLFTQVPWETLTPGVSPPPHRLPRKDTDPGVTLSSGCSGVWEHPTCDFSPADRWLFGPQRTCSYLSVP